MKRNTFSGRIAGALLLALLTALNIVGPVSADAPADAPGAYLPITLKKDGTASESALRELTDAVDAEKAKGATQVAVLIHGFNVEPQDAAKQYGEISRRLREEAGAVGLQLAVVGLHWASHPGNQGKWVTAALGNRFTSLLGFKKAVRNPYLAKVALARQTGSTGFRSLLIRLQDRFPGLPVNVFAHSLGAEVAVSALAPVRNLAGVEQPERALELGMVVLAGADLDSNAFSRANPCGAAQALRQAQVWWITVPEKGQADGILEMRRGAGRPDALGNRGLKLSREDMDRLLERRGLVVDQSNIPVSHEITRYYNPHRLGELAASLLYLENPEDAVGQESLLASLDRILDGRQFACGGGQPVTKNNCVDFYAAWRAQPGRNRYGVVAVQQQSTPRRGQAILRTDESESRLGKQAAR